MAPGASLEVAVPARGSPPSSCPLPPVPPGPGFAPPTPTPGVEVAERGPLVEVPPVWEGTSPRPDPAVVVDAPEPPLPVGSRTTSSVTSESPGTVSGLTMTTGGPPKGKRQHDARLERSLFPLSIPLVLRQAKLSLTASNLTAESSSSSSCTGGADSSIDVITSAPIPVSLMEMRVPAVEVGALHLH